MEKTKKYLRNTQGLLQKERANLQKARVEIMQLKNEIKSTKSSKRKGKRDRKYYTTNTSNKVKDDRNRILLGKMTKTILNVGGISRFTIQSNDFHKLHPNITKDLFEFRSWNELKMHVKLCLKVDSESSYNKLSLDGKLDNVHRKTFLNLKIFCLP